jgi:hypothetical protein
MLLQSSSDSDNENWNIDDPFSISGPRIIIHPLKEAATQFLIEAVNRNAHNAFSELHVADSFRQQFFLAVGDVRSDGLIILIGEISIISTC